MNKSYGVKNIDRSITPPRELSDAILIKDLNVLSQAERKKLLYDFNNTAADYPRDKCVHELFEEQVQRTPDKTAVIACDKTLTYSELNEQANRIAHGLIEKGVKPGDIVAFMLSRKSYLIATMFGILKAGAAYMPIDPDYPSERISILLNNGNVNLFVTDIFSDKSVDFNGETIFVNQLLDCNICCSPKINCDTKDYFCALHTSGSTGTPKCALIKHINMVNFTYSNLFLLKGIKCTVAINIVTFDVFEMDTVFSLICGVKCVLASEEQQFVQQEFERMMDNCNDCLFWATPTKILNYINNSQSKGFFKKIKVFVCGGEIFTQELLHTIVSLNNEVEVYTVYGPTETLIYSTMQHLYDLSDCVITSAELNTFSAEVAH